MATVRPPPVCGPLERPSKTSTSFPTLSIPPPSPPNYRVVLPNCKRVVRDRRCSESVGIISGPWVFFLPEVTQRDRGRNWSLATIKPTKTVFGFIRGLAFGERHMRMKGRKWTEGDFPTQKKRKKKASRRWNPLCQLSVKILIRDHSRLSRYETRSDEDSQRPST